ncbi:hypothetical protein ATI61_103512 [Archangium gephyra]|uniref:Lipoprotein n=1 Tax=Archangium gephyra TaxID=48 RepID=A0AAC8TDG2_9BACT|nr:hypothetical protein [Archangium gephyra]AKJ01797.1 Hypothetical protein AA314_03423 [Archangium gephyra]REG34606.1 hypothetical protein ATI61_103512 [Archangium gephyra]
MRREKRPVSGGIRALLLPLVLAGCASKPAQQVPLADVPPPLQGTAPEQAVTLLPLGGPLQSENAELSGLAWYGEHLVMLPQYPSWRSDSDPCLYTVSKADVLARLDHTASGPLEPRCIPFDSGGLEKHLPGFEGYEAIGFVGDQAYLTVETRQGTGKGFLVTGRIAPDLSVLKLEASPRASLPLPAQVSNAGFETLVVGGERLLALYEANGVRVNPAPAAESFDRSLTPTGKLSLPAIEYRVTDATSLDSAGRFWVMNYSFPGTSRAYDPAPDPLMARYGTGPTHARKPQVERLIELQVQPTGIVLTERPPLQLQLSNEAPRNWEGVVRLEGRGFLLVTDKFPGTLLGFVPSPP